MKKSISLFAVFLSIHLTIFSQVYLDSLWWIWNTPIQADTIRLKAIQKIDLDGYLFSQPDNAFYTSQLQYDFAKSKRLKKNMSNALYSQWASFKNKGDYTIAIDYSIRYLFPKSFSNVPIETCLFPMG